MIEISKYRTQLHKYWQKIEGGEPLGLSEFEEIFSIQDSLNSIQELENSHPTAKNTARRLREQNHEYLEKAYRAKLELYERKLRDFEQKYDIKFDDAARRFESDEIGDSMSDHQCYFDYLFLKGMLKEKKDLQKQTHLLSRSQ